MIHAGALGLQLVALAFAFLIVLEQSGRSRGAAWARGLLATVGVYTIVPPVASPRCGATCRSVVGGSDVGCRHQRLAVAAVLFTFFASFPRRMVQFALVFGRVLWVPMAFPSLIPFGARCHVHGLLAGAHDRHRRPGPVFTAATAGYIGRRAGGAGFNYRRLTDLNERRRVKVLVVGAVGGLLPGFLVVASYGCGRTPIRQIDLRIQGDVVRDVTSCSSRLVRLRDPAPSAVRHPG